MKYELISVLTLGTLLIVIVAVLSTFFIKMQAKLVAISNDFKRAELLNYLQMVLAIYEAQLVKSQFIAPNAQPQSFLDRYTSGNGRYKPEFASELLYLMKRNVEINQTGGSANPDEPEELLKPFGRLRSTILRIVDHYLELIKINNEFVIKNGLAYDLAMWLRDQSYRGLITEDERIQFEERIDSQFSNKETTK